MVVIHIADCTCWVQSEVLPEPLVNARRLVLVAVFHYQSLSIRHLKNTSEWLTLPNLN